LKDPTITLKIKSQNVLTATSINIWQKNKRNKKPENVSNVIRKDISPRTIKKSRQ